MMRQAAYVTTSWDDGHPLDFRVAELLAKYGIQGTFYVPRTSTHPTMTGAQLRELASSFELGAHTLNHVVLTRASEQIAWEEVAGSKAWLEDNTGSQCFLFCPPTGRYARRHLEMVRRAGYLGMRSAELGSLDLPRRQAGLVLMPTTLQAHPHHPAAFVRNAVKRAAFGNLWRLLIHGRSTEWPAIAQRLLQCAITWGGVFHLWGHSWELQENAQWQRLEQVLRLLSAHAPQAPARTNGQLCLKALSETETDTLWGLGIAAATRGSGR